MHQFAIIVLALRTTLAFTVKFVDCGITGMRDDEHVIVLGGDCNVTLDLDLDWSGGNLMKKRLSKPNSGDLFEF